MTKSDNNKKPKIVPHNAPLNNTEPRWICNHHSSGSDIEAYVVASDRLQVIAETLQTEGVDARANAEFIVQAVNDYEKHQRLITALIGALELCLECKSVSWEAEQEAELVLTRIRAAEIGKK